MNFRLFILAWVLVPTGCGALPNVAEEPSASANAIIGGVSDSADDSVVTLFAIAASGNSGTLCTASVIAPTVLLTAAHCVLPGEVPIDARFRAYQGDDFTTHPNRFIAVKETHFDPEFSIDDLGAGHDVAVAILAEAISAPVLQINRVPLTATVVGKSVRLVGYGASAGNPLTGTGAKRQVSTVVDAYDDLLLNVGKPDAVTCNGDSGGPAFLRMDGPSSREVIVGIASFGSVHCGGSAYHTRVDVYASFLDGWVEHATTGADPLPPANGQ